HRRAEQSALPFSYPDVGATATAPPSGWDIHQTRVSLGYGPAVFAAACEALRCWTQFDLGWIRAADRAAPLAPGEAVAVVARTCGLWSINTCRIVYVVDEPRRFGFAYGTLPSHVARGEERFLVELGAADEVTFEILAFSRPSHWLTRVGRPVMRLIQRQFARAAGEAMRRAMATAVHPQP
ncbi:MAG TPA: DUF1990 domain-containing protein, partial [Planctomycetaceae bacterium]|nr:DUF1990 domain-containing protein [Planctomycetaceae bacterium]